MSEKANNENGASLTLNHKLSPTVGAAITSVSSIAVTFVSFPLDLLRVRLQSTRKFTQILHLILLTDEKKAHLFLNT